MCEEFSQIVEVQFLIYIVSLVVADRLESEREVVSHDVEEFIVEMERKDLVYF